MAQKHPSLLGTSLLIDFPRTAGEIDDVQPDLEVFRLAGLKLFDLLLNRLLFLSDLGIFLLPILVRDMTIKAIIVEPIEAPLQAHILAIVRFQRALLVFDVASVVLLDLFLQAARIIWRDVLEELEDTEQLLLDRCFGRVAAL